MSKFEIIAMALMIVYVLDKLYLFPLSISLETIPDSKRSATYLAKSIAKKAKCADILLFSMTYEERDTVLNTACMVNNDVIFNLYIFLNTDIRNEWINTSTKTNPYTTTCFKKGPAYLICEADTTADQNSKPILHGQKYYNQFPGETITYKDD